jgi:amidohydrolase
MHTEWQNAIEPLRDDLISWRHDFHARPELSRHEHRTSARVREILTTIPGLQVHDPLDETDVVAVLNADRTGPCIALRADMDALPIEEQTGKPYASQNSGVMHACGHDGHTTTLLGVARVLAGMADRWPGPIKFIFQPDEEGDGGAERLCDKGVLSNPDVKAIVGLHAWPQRRVGTVSVRPGPSMAANTGILIEIEGQGCHGAYPHRGVDTIVVAAHVVTALQTIVSRTVNPLEPAVVTIGEIKAGATTNVIPATCRMQGTIRFTNPQVGEDIGRRITRIVEHTALAHGAKVHVKLIKGYPPLANDERVAAIVYQSAAALLGEENIITNEPISMGVEDFAFYAQHVPACMFRLGVCPRDQESYPGLHSPHFDFNDDALPIGVAMFCEITQRFFESGTA